MSKIQDLKDLVEDAIEHGATTVEGVHQQIAALPFDQLEKIAAIEGLVGNARSLHDETVGTVYETIRKINARIGELADETLHRLGQGQSQGEE